MTPACHPHNPRPAVPHRRGALPRGGGARPRGPHWAARGGRSVPPSRPERPPQEKRRRTHPHCHEPGARGRVRPGRCKPTGSADSPRDESTSADLPTTLLSSRKRNALIRPPGRATGSGGSGAGFLPDTIEERTTRRREKARAGAVATVAGASGAGRRWVSLSIRPPWRPGVPGTRRVLFPAAFRLLSLCGGRRRGSGGAAAAAVASGPQGRPLCQGAA